MSDIYVRSSDGSDSDNGSTWALAKATSPGAAAIDVAGDTINYASTHSESSGTALTLSWAGTASNPTKILSVSDSAAPPTTMTPGASIATTGSLGITMVGSCYVDGMSFTAGGLITLCSTGGTQTYRGCKFRTNNAGSGGGFSVANNNVLTRLKILDSTFYFSAAGNRLIAQHSVLIRGGSMEPGSTTPTNFLTFGSDGRGGETLVEGFDFSGFSSGMNLVASNPLASGRCVFRNCKLPTSWSGSLVSGLVGMGVRVSMYNCDNAATNYRMWVEDYAGSIKSETTIVRADGATDGTQPFSWKMTSSANCNAALSQLETDELPPKWNEVVGSAITVQVEIAHDSVTNLTDGEVALEVQYLGTSGVPLSLFISDSKSSFLATAADQTTSSATWTTTGMTNPNKQVLSVTFTPQEVGFILPKVILGKASKTIYVCPKVQVS